MDSMIESVGSFGIAQKFYIIIIGFSSSLIAVMFYSSVFIMAVPELICTINNKSTAKIHNAGFDSIFTYYIDCFFIFKLL
jgi:hypothetical protein